MGKPAGIALCALQWTHAVRRYIQRFFSCRAGALSRLTEDAAMKITELPLLTGKNLPVVFAGDGAKLCMDAIGEQIPGSRIAPAYHYYQQAACAALLAEEKLLHGEGIPSDALAPFYLRLPQAERELRKNKIMNDWEDFYMIALGADHGGYQLKETIKKHLEEQGHSLPRFRHKFHRIGRLRPNRRRGCARCDQRRL